MRPSLNNKFDRDDPNSPFKPFLIAVLFRILDLVLVLKYCMGTGTGTGTGTGLKRC
jgi:hypothetical protein